MNPENRIIKDNELAAEMEEKGYLVLPFLNEDEVKQFDNLYHHYHKEDPEFFYKSYFSSDVDYKKKVEELIIEIFERKLGHLFYNHQSFGGMFVAKPPKEKGHFTAHQDWSFTDETVYPSYNMWCPLTDVDDTNGNLNVLSGSHRFVKTIRGFGTPDVYEHLHKDLEPNMISIPMKAGEVVIFYHGLVHGSTRNDTENARVSLGLSVIHKDAPLRFHYFDDKTSKLNVYASNPEFYLNYVDHRDEKPTTIDYLGEVDFDFKRLSLEELKQLVITNQGYYKSLPTHASPTKELEAKKLGLMQRIKELLH